MASLFNRESGLFEPGDLLSLEDPQWLPEKLGHSRLDQAEAQHEARLQEPTLPNRQVASGIGGAVPFDPVQEEAGN